MPKPSQQEENLRSAGTAVPSQSLPQSESDREVAAVMAVNVADPASRARARATVEQLAGDSAAAARSQLLEKRILAMAQADTGSDRIATDLQRLAKKARELDATYTRPRRPGLLKRFMGTPKRKVANTRATLDELNDIVNTLFSSAEILRQNEVAFAAFSADLSAEAQRIAADVKRADELKVALTSAIERAQTNGISAETIRFAQGEVLFPLESHRQFLQSLKAINQQATVSLVILRETNAMLISHVRLIALAARNTLDVATTLQRRSAERESSQGGGSSRSGSSSDEDHLSSDTDAFTKSLDELYRVLHEHDVWRSTSQPRKEKAIVSLSELSNGVFDAADLG